MTDTPTPDTDDPAEDDLDTVDLDADDTGESSDASSDDSSDSDSDSDSDDSSDDDSSDSDSGDDDSSDGDSSDADDASSDDESDDASDDDESSDDDGSSDAEEDGDVAKGSSEGDEGDGRRRRRRGRRGGRGRGSGGGQGSGGGTGGGSKGGGGRSQSSGGGGRSEDERLEKAIASGGTRTAARKGGGGGGGGRGRGRGGRNQRSSVPDEVRRAIMDGPPKTMLVTSRPDRTQVVVMEERTAVEHYVTRTEDVTYVGNVYMARVQNVLPGMEAAFLDIGKGRNGVLYAGEVNYDELDVEDGAGKQPRIEQALQQGQTVLVQVTKDPMGSKGPRLTMQVSLAGRYMVLSPHSDVFGISRKLADDERDRLRRIVKKLRPKEHGLIVRTAASGASDEAIEADLQRLLEKWQRIEDAAAEAKPLTAVYEEPPLVVKVIRDNFGSDFDRLVVDDATLHEQVRDYLGQVAPELLGKVHLWEPPAEGEGERDLFAAYEVTEQLRKATDRKVWLPSGGYLIIEATEAMKVIDVNTGKFTGGKGSNLEEVVFRTNVEAAKEIVRQLRLRDLGGIVVIDFIDMLLKANQDEVLRTLERELLRDRTKTRVSDVSRLGLVQMTRKNVSAGLVETFSHKCETCQGRGFTVDVA